MIPQGADYERVCICVPSATMTRFMSFEVGLEGLHVPNYSLLYRVQSLSPAKSRNDAVRECLKKKDERFNWFWFIDDDHQFPPEVLLKLLVHNLPLVVPLVCYSVPPYQPVLFKGEVVIRAGEHWEGDLAVWAADLDLIYGPPQVIDPAIRRKNVVGSMKKLIERGWKQKPIKQFIPMTWRELDGLSGLFPVFACGGAGMLVKREVFEKIDEPWFEMGQTNPEQASEDVFFSQKVRNAGLGVYVDLDIRLGHNNVAGATPVQLETGQWTIDLAYESGQIIRLGRMDRSAEAQQAEAEKRPALVEKLTVPEKEGPIQAIKTE